MDASNHPRSVVVDDEPLLREAIRGRLAASEQIIVVGEGSVGEDVFFLVEQLKPDVLILDPAIPAPRGRNEKFS